MEHRAFAQTRCRLHGGASTGPRTPEGLLRSKRANWKHGLYSAKANEEVTLFRRFLRECKEQCSALIATI
jgi:hypothetical protein